MRWLGAGLLMAGSWGVAWLWGREQRCIIEACGSFLLAAQRMERAIRCEGRGLREIFSTLAPEQGAAGEFFRQMLSLWEEERDLTAIWAESCEGTQLPAEGERIWRELGRRLDGDRESVCASISAAAEEFSMLCQSLRSALPARLRLSGTVSLSAAAFLAILLL